MANPKLDIEISAKLDSLDRDFGRVSGMASDTAKRIENIFSGVQLNIGALASFAGFTGFSSIIKQSIDAADAMGKMAQKVGVSVESLSALEYAGKLSDVSFEQLGVGLKKLSVNLNEVAAGGGGDAANALKSLGVSATDSGGKLRNADTVFSDVAEALSKMKDGAGKTATAVAIFGKAGADLIPMLNQGKTGLREAADEATAFGVALSTRATKAAEDFNDNLTRLKTAGQGVGSTVMKELIETLGQLSTEFVNSAKEGNGFSNMMGGALKTTLETGIILGANVAYVFKGVGTEIGGIAAQMNALAQFDFEKFKGIGEAMREDAKGARAELDALEKRILNPQSSSASTGTGGNKSESSGYGSSSARTAALDDGQRLIDQLNARLISTKLLTEVEKTQAEIYSTKGKDYTQTNKETALSIAARADYEKTMLFDLDAELVTRKAINKEFDALDARLKSLVGGTDIGKNTQNMLDEALAESALLSGKIDTSTYDQIIAKLHEVKDEGKDTFKELERAIDGWGKTSAAAFVDFAYGAKTSFSDLILSMSKEIATMAVYENITRPIATGLSGWAAGLFKSSSASPGASYASNVLAMQQEAINELALIGSAKGNVFTSQGLSAFSGRVVSSPTVFPFANGIGLMGEAGPEAILPLKRGRDGKLGITSSNGGSMQTVNVYQTNNIDSRSDKASIMQGLLTIKEQTKAEILESMRRGGVFART
jgi:hypothetical protein